MSSPHRMADWDGLAATLMREVPGLGVSRRALDRHAVAHDASHYLLTPELVVRPSSAEQVAAVLRACAEAGAPITFRSAGTSLSGQAVTDAVLVDTRQYFRMTEVLDDGARVRVRPGVTVRQVNARLAPYGTRLGPDPASESACTLGGVIANNSSGMQCGTELNTYATLESMVLVLPSGTRIDSAVPDASAELRRREPALWEGLARLRDRVRGNRESVTTVRRLFAMKNTMGYGLNAFLDYDDPVEILVHLMIGSEGTLGFVSEAVLRTVRTAPEAATGLMVFSDLGAATDAVPQLVETGTATAELLDAASLRASQADRRCPSQIGELDVAQHAALLVEYQGMTRAALDDAVDSALPRLKQLPTLDPVELTEDTGSRAALWRIRKGLFSAVAGARPRGTNALLEDIVVGIDVLGQTCLELTHLFEQHNYEESVIFGHAKDGNIHFMLNERFDDASSMRRYTAFTEDMVDLVLRHGGSLKAEHGTGRIMAPFVRRQYGDELYAVMWELKRLVDPSGLLNPGTVLSDDPTSYLRDLKPNPPVEPEVDRCVECGYCEPVCPSRDLTLTPRQRIVLRREMVAARQRGDVALVRELERDYEYEGDQTCAVDGMCATACPVRINTGDLVRRLRHDSASPVAERAWAGAARAWGVVTPLGGAGLSVAKALPSAVPTAVTRIGRSLLGEDAVPLYDDALPRGGRRRPKVRSHSPGAVLFSTCLGQLFGPAEGGGEASPGPTRALLSLCERAGVELRTPRGLGRMCCGTPWKSKGYSRGHEVMIDRVVPALVHASDEGRLPIICEASSCVEGLSEMMASHAPRLRIVDAMDFVADGVLPRLTEVERVESVAVHPTCSTQRTGATPALLDLARAVSDDVVVPASWGCCGFAGDRGLLHPELTASAAAPQASEVNARGFAAYVSCNRTCEIAMTRATGRPYRHVLEVLAEATTANRRGPS